MKFLFIAAITLFSGSTSASAQSLESMKAAQNLGMVLASEGKCGFSFDQSAIGAWIDENVDAADMGFASTLSMMQIGSEAQLQGMSESSLTAHCRAVERNAKHYNFIE